MVLQQQLHFQQLHILGDSETIEFEHFNKAKPIEDLQTFRKT